MAGTKHGRGIGHIIAPPRFLLFLGVTAIASYVAIRIAGLRYGAMIGFDAGALVFLAACAPLLRDESARMRQAARRNDANRVMMLLLTGAVSVVILAAVASELMEVGAAKPQTLVLIVGTLVLSWIFSNTIYALHYAHLFYGSGQAGRDAGGLQFPETPEPDYWDFLYFAFCLGMTFQTSDVSITSRRMRRTVTLHCLAAFVFNLGIVAFTINVLGSGG